MGRSVNTVSGAICIIYTVFEGEEDWQWDDYIDFLQERVVEKYPSFVGVDSWDGNEEHRILENELAKVVVCEYCDLVSINLVVRKRDVEFEHEENLAEHWCAQIAKGFAELFPNRLRRLGTFSNGESVFEKVNKDESK